MITLTQLLKFSWFSLFTWQVCHRKHLSSLSSNSKPGGHLGDDQRRGHQGHELPLGGESEPLGDGRQVLHMHTGQLTCGLLGQVIQCEAEAI